MDSTNLNRLERNTTNKGYEMTKPWTRIFAQPVVALSSADPERRALHTSELRSSRVQIIRLTGRKPTKKVWSAALNFLRTEGSDLFLPSKSVTSTAFCLQSLNKIFLGIIIGLLISSCANRPNVLKQNRDCVHGSVEKIGSVYLCIDVGGDAKVPEEKP